MRERNRKRPDQSDAIGFDPIAVTLALWLGMVVCATAMKRIADETASMNRLEPQAASQLLRPAVVPFVPTAG